MRAVTYVRVSTEQKRQPDGTMKGQTVEPQRVELAEYAKTRGIPLLAEFSDVISGKKFNREGLDAMRLGAARGEFDTILIVKLDRIGRSISGVLKLIEEFEKAGVAIVATSQGIDTLKSNPCGKLILHVLAACAEFERSLICERTKAGLAVAKANGVQLGKPSKVLVPNWREVTTAWKDKTGGIGLRGLAADLGGVSVSTAARLADEIGART